jgi:hypothetical protein
MTMNNLTSYKVIGVSIILSVFIYSTLSILGNGLPYFFKGKKVKGDISVKGSSSTEFTSDLIVWSASFSKKDMNLKIAYSQIKKDKQIIKEFLISKGVKDSEITFKSIDIDKKYNYKSRYNNDGDKVDSETIFDGYSLTQDFVVQSGNVDLVQSISNEVTDLIEQEIYINSFSPNYYYSNLGALKIKMISEASKDGLLRAETAVYGGGGDLGELLETSIGVIQILGKNSDESFSWGGTFNTKNKYKTAYVTVNQRYAID